MTREASALWQGSGKEGRGELSTQSGALRSLPFSFTSRFENGQGTNPEELLGAAHAGCFSMALAFMLSEQGFNPQELRTSARVNIQKEGESWWIHEINLSLQAKIPEIQDLQFQDLAEKAKASCPVSRLFREATVTLEAKLI
jgi:osmotically inducible protein OsmC